MTDRTVLPLVVVAALLSSHALGGESGAESGKSEPDKITTAKVESKKDEPAATVAAAAGPVNGHIIHHASEEKLCIGGVLCSEFCAIGNHDCKPADSLTIRLDEPARINTIQLHAHDDIGKTRRSRLVIKVNGKPVGDSLVYKLGSTLSFDIGETGELITIESAHQYNGFLRGGEEAVIWDVYVFGDERG
ncbi:MAG TPA: hypothetical protein VK862_03825 [Afifellaceae bacterium]|nr:hypothetical protein [Afifellaceae bacterium]